MGEGVRVLEAPSPAFIVHPPPFQTTVACVSQSEALVATDGYEMAITRSIHAQ